jgi:hypothetical protein
VVRGAEFHAVAALEAAVERVVNSYL